MSQFQTEYKNKITSATNAVKMVKSGDVVFCGEFAQNIEVLDEALSLRKNELKDIILVTTTRSRPLKCVDADPKRETFTWDDWHFSGVGRKYSELGLANYIPFSYHQGPRAVELYNKVDVVMIQVSPMDEFGYFNFSTSCSMSSVYCQKARHVIVEVNKNSPRCLGGEKEGIHISKVTSIVEGPNNPLVQLPKAAFTEADTKIATHVMNMIENGSTIQLGIGGLPNIIGEMIAKSDLKDLGVHTEMLADSYVDMYEAGKLSGMKKNVNKGKIVYTFAMGSQKLYDFLHNNPACATFPVHYTNDPAVIAQNDKVVAINNALEVDLFTQVASESSGARQISGSGGQLDFILGAFKSEGGKGLICINSTFKKKDGTLASRIVPAFKPGTIVTCPRSIVHYVVTEFGMAQLKGKSTWQRAEALINIAHPDFKDELVKQAEELNIWRLHSKYTE